MGFISKMFRNKQTSSTSQNIVDIEGFIPQGESTVSKSLAPHLPSFIGKPLTIVFPESKIKRYQEAVKAAKTSSEYQEVTDKKGRLIHSAVFTIDPQHINQIIALLSPLNRTTTTKCLIDGREVYDVSYILSCYKEHFYPKNLESCNGNNVLGCRCGTPDDWYKMGKFEGEPQFGKWVWCFDKKKIKRALIESMGEILQLCPACTDFDIDLELAKIPDKLTITLYCGFPQLFQKFNITDGFYAKWQEELENARRVGVDLVRVMPSEQTSCPICKHWRGKTFSISGNSRIYLPISFAVQSGLFHPYCTHYLEPLIPHN